MLGVLFIAAGANHFIMPALYERIIPPFVPWPGAMVIVSGVFEVLGGVGVLVPALRRAAGWGLIALLVAVFPANIYMATHRIVPPEWPMAEWMLWARLPLQGVFVAWVWWAAELGRGSRFRAR